MRAGDTGDTEDSADEDALAQVREGEPASFGSGNFERSESTNLKIYKKFTKNIIKIEFKS